MLDSLPSAFSDEGVMVLLTLVALAAVWIPFTRGMRLCFQAFRATERLSPAELTKQSSRRKDRRNTEPVSLLMMGTCLYTCV